MTGQLIQQTREDIEGMIARDELILPTLPEIALKVRDIAEDENASIQDMARALTKDPALSARLLRVTNSPMVRTMVPITDVTTAISRLGIDFTKSYITNTQIQEHKIKKTRTENKITIKNKNQK